MKTDTFLQGLIYAALFGAGTAAGAYLMVPVPPVPITLQTLFLYLAGALLGGRLALLSQVVYLILGIIGLPVFAGGKAGLGVLFGPTGGYLIGFLPAAYIVGKWNEMLKAPSFSMVLLSMIAGTIPIYVLGVLQLCFVAKLGVGKAVSVGMLPFLIGDGIKIVVATLLAQRVVGHLRFRGKNND
ncbi:MAG: biotin transporter BioY [Deltaproteobacteria bacterium]|nr:biotin transporter BioY [Deltaproteobacteria bacterium]